MVAESLTGIHQIDLLMDRQREWADVQVHWNDSQYVVYEDIPRFLEATLAYQEQHINANAYKRPEHRLNDDELEEVRGEVALLRRADLSTKEGRDAAIEWFEKEAAKYSAIINQVGEAGKLTKSEDIRRTSSFYIHGVMIIRSRCRESGAILREIQNGANPEDSKK